MEDEIRKRNTDCVYFLASPLTCKKGNECEFRHSESARLNPIDCWYWLSGNCLNPTCAFRHPPLGFEETSSDATHPQPSIIPTNKVEVPCYFYFNAYCIKGDRCPFLHGNDTLLAQPVSKTLNESLPTQTREKRISSTCDMGSPLVDAPPNPFDGISKEHANENHSENLPVTTLVRNVAEERNPSPELSDPEFDEALAKPCEDATSPGIENEDIDNKANINSDRSSEEPVNNSINADEWWESSPGFDVLVDDGSEQLAYEDDIDGCQDREEEPKRLHSNYMPYNYEDSVGYDPVDYPHAGYLNDHGLYESYNHFDSGDPDFVERASGGSRDRMQELLFIHRQKPLAREDEIQRFDAVDLRHRLRKRQRKDSYHEPYGARKRYSTHNRENSREQLIRNHFRAPHHARFSPEVGASMVGSYHRRSGTAVYDNHQYGRPGFADRNRHPYGRQEREMRRRGRFQRRAALSSEVLESLVDNDRRRTQASAFAFSGPKTLAQIKEEKKRAEEENGFGNMRHSFQGRSATTDFQGPKPLRDILKEKGKPSSPRNGLDGSTIMCEETEFGHSHANEKRYHRRYKRNFSDEDDGYSDDDDY